MVIFFFYFSPKLGFDIFSCKFSFPEKKALTFRANFLYRYNLHACQSIYSRNNTNFPECHLLKLFLPSCAQCIQENLLCAENCAKI